MDDWQRLLGLPIDAARAELGVTAAEPCRPLQLEALFGNAEPA